MIFDYTVHKTGVQEVDEKLDLLISDSNELYFTMLDLKLDDADLVLLKGTHVYEDVELDFND